MRFFPYDHILIAVVFGFILDLVFGDPRWLYHPVRLIGRLITLAEKFFRRICPNGKNGQRAAGVLTALLVIFASTLIPFFLLRLCYHIHVVLGLLLETFWCYQLLATKSLKEESMRVYKAVKSGDLVKARHAVSMIVGRDTERLDLTGVTKAAVETVAENASDGVIAPLLFLMAGGATGGFLYKSINTMDSMIGYVNDRYRYFGTFAARLDDLVNFIPARISGILMILASFLCGFNGKKAWKIFLRDRKNHASPNSAHTEAVMAGALGIQLAGDAWYFGELHKKKYIGDPDRPVDAECIPQANRILYLTAVLALVVSAAVRIFVLFLLHGSLHILF